MRNRQSDRDDRDGPAGHDAPEDPVEEAAGPGPQPGASDAGDTTPAGAAADPAGSVAEGAADPQSEPAASEPPSREPPSRKPEPVEPELTLHPADVAQKSFPTARRGYDRARVREFLETAAAGLAAAGERIVDLEQQLARAAASAQIGISVAGADEEVVLEAVAAEAWRDEVLGDLDRRRRDLNAEVLRLRAGRDRLRSDVAAVVEAVGEQMGRLEGSLRAARAAGDGEMERLRAEPPPSRDEQRAELQAARLAGFVGPAAASQAPRTAVGEPEAAAAPAPEPQPEAAAGSEPATAPEPDADPAVAAGDLFARLRAERADAGS